MTEIWKDIKGYEGMYQVSNLGRVKSIDRIVMHSLRGKTRLIGNIIKLSDSRGGYLSASLYSNSKRQKFLVHRLMATAFIENPNNKEQVNHKNGVKIDNRIDNIEWVTHSENIQHAYDIGLIPDRKGKNHPMYGRKHSIETKEKISNALKKHYEH